MLRLKVDQAKSFFFDRPVVSAVDRAKRKVLARFGAFVRQRAKSSIRKRKAVSAPGAPPSSRTGLVRRLIYFVFDPSRESVVVGPAALNGGESDALEMLEFGGTTRRRLWVVPPGELRGKARRGEAGKVQFRTGRSAPLVPVKHQARPFMGPALDKELPNLPGMWRDSVVD